MVNDMSNEDNVKTWALVNNDTGLVINMILWDGQAKVDFGDSVTAIEVNELSGADIGYTFKDGTFIAPEPSPPTEEEIKQGKQQKIALNMAKKASMMDDATQNIEILQDAIELEMATDEEATQLPLWKKYRILLNRLDANTDEDIVWPDKP